MFCPQCGSENDVNKRYCRSCGQELSAVRLALDGRVEAAIKMSEGERRQTPHRIRVGLAIFLIAIGVATIISGGSIGFSNIQSAALVLILMMVFFIYTSRKAHRIARTLDVEDQKPELNRTDSDPLSIGTGNQTTRKHAPDSSVTDQETLKLRRPDHFNQQR